MNHANHTLENNPVAYKTIQNAFASNKVAHAYLFSAQKNYEIEHEPLFLIGKLLEDKEPSAYPDLTIIDGSQGEIRKEHVISAIEKLQQTALDASGVKILYVKNVENGNSSSLNSLLKFMEEPTPKTFFVFSTNALPKVLSTIKSRSQVLTLRSPSRSAFISALQVSGIATKKAKVLAAVTSSQAEAVTLSDSKDFDSLTKQITGALAKAISQKEKVFLELPTLIRKDNYSYSLNLLVAYFNDVWKIKDAVDLTFDGEKNTLEAYADKHFDYEKALLLTSDFINKIPANVNFDLYKNRFLIELEGCYA